MVKFKSQATGDLLMLQPHAHALLSKLGKSDDQGIIEVADMPAALAVLRDIPGDEVHEQELPADGHDEGEEDKHAEPAFADERISLKKRAWPLIQMIERAQAAGKPIVWGV